VRPRRLSSDLPLSGFDPNALPAFSFVTPNLCCDTNDFDIATGDAWLQNFIPGSSRAPHTR
jgi:hypothetical protein